MTITLATCQHCQQLKYKIPLLHNWVQEGDIVFLILLLRSLCCIIVNSLSIAVMLDSIAVPVFAVWLNLTNIRMNTRRGALSMLYYFYHLLFVLTRFVMEVVCSALLCLNLIQFSSSNNFFPTIIIFFKKKRCKSIIFSTKSQFKFSIYSILYKSHKNFVH